MTYKILTEGESQPNDTGNHDFKSSVYVLQLMLNFADRMSNLHFSWTIPNMCFA